MRILRRLFQVAIPVALSTLFLSLILSVASPQAATIYVSPAGGGDGATPGSPTTLQAALTAAQGNGEADTIYLQAGAYIASGGPFSYNASQSDEVKLTGGWITGFTTQYRGMDPLSMTALDGQNLNRVFEVRSETAGLIVKFTVENTAFLNGLADVAGFNGAGLRSNCANGGTIDLYVRRCLFQNNNGVAGATNTYGGGLFANHYVEIYDSIFFDNTARGGGAIYFSYAAPLTNALEPLVERCTFTNNKTLLFSCSVGGVTQCYDGGGDIFSRVSPIIRNTSITGDGTLSGGGAIDHGYGGNLRLINSTISGKRSWFWGGGIHIWDANAEIYNSLIADNAAGQTGVYGRGGGLAIYDPTPETPRTVKVYNSTFVKNRSNGSSDGLYGMAIDNRVQSLTVYNSIFWDNGSAPQFPVYTTNGGTSSLYYSDYQYGWGGTGSNNINTDPAFVNFAGNNFHLTDGSPCKNTGTENPDGTFLYTLYPTSSDRDGRSRIIDTTVDMGAYEFDNGPFANAVGRGDPKLAYDPVNKRYLAVYPYLDGTGGATLYGRLINPDGTPYTTGLQNGLVAGEFPISEQKSYQRLMSAVVYDDFHKKFMVVWDSFNASTYDSDLQGQLVNPDGSLDGWNLNVSNKMAVSEWKPAIAYDGTNHQTLMVWNNNDHSLNEEDVFGRFFVKDVAQGTDAFPIAAVIGSIQAEPGVAFDGINKRFLVVFGDDRDFASSEGEIYGQLINSDRTLKGGNFSITENRAEDQVYPAVAFNPSTKQYLVAWEHTVSGSENDDVFGRMVNHDGTLDGAAFPISNTSAKQDSIAVACHTLANRFLAVWQDSRDVAAGRNIYGQWIKGDGTLQGDNFPVIDAPSDQDYPYIAYGPGSFLAVYEDLLNPGPPPNLGVGYFEIKYHGVTAKSIGNGSGAVASNVGGIDYLYPAAHEMTSDVVTPGTAVVITATADPEVSVSWKGYCAAAGGVEDGNGTGLATCTFAALDGYKWVKATFTQYKIWLPLLLK